MNIKTIVIRAAKRVQQLVRVILGVRAVSVSPAAAKRGKAATIAPQRVADADAPITRCKRYGRRHDRNPPGSGAPQLLPEGQERILRLAVGRDPGIHPKLLRCAGRQYRLPADSQCRRSGGASR